MSARAVEEAGEDDLDGLAVFAVDDVEAESVAPVTAVEPMAMATVTEAEVDVAALPVEPLGPALVVVPDIEQMTLRKAAKELAAVGLKLSVRDEYGDAVPRWSWGDYEVRTQKVDAGTEVVPGATVKAKARPLRRLVSGY
ncbi:PASTA domain-containing protein [Nannocystis sp. SCPEA4]|uniref:PASTA domain-containing protein n=1 Tax=Nannocystis sp. SCPEA4 TaxID=2996787 RepID=UPI00226F7CC3|nr:PASTA domain-containing protein [Nannocystis sp. SCPEA4]